MGGSKGKKNTGDGENETLIRVRHRVKTEPLVEVNEKLTPVQKDRLLMTPFNSLVYLKKKINISGVLLREVLRRWDTHSEGIRVGNRIISFRKLDVCLGLGLRICGEPVIDDAGLESRVKLLFNGEVINVSTIVQKMGELTSDSRVEDFCRLYILLAFATFYFPQTTPKINTLPFSVLDDLESLNMYDWGGKVYNNLVDSLNRVTPLFNEGKNEESVSIVGCAALLQIWTVEHFTLRTTPENTHFPRFLDWVEVGSGKCVVSKIFETRKFVEYVSLSEEERSKEVVHEAIHEYDRGYRERSFSKEKEISNRISSIEDEREVFKKMDHKRASRSHEIGDSQNVAEVCYEPIVASVRTTTRDEKKLNISLVSLYNYCTRKSTQRSQDETLVRLDDHHLTRSSLEYLAPRKWVDNMVFCFVSPMMMEEETTGFVTRFLFNSFFAGEVIKELHYLQQGATQNRWTIRKFFKHVSLKSFTSTPIDVLRGCNRIFAPACFQNHWVCYVLVPDERKMYVLDSLEHDRNDLWLNLDFAMRIRFQELYAFIVEKQVDDTSLSIVYENMPKQHNFHDCGMYVLKYLEHWNGEGTIPNYSQDDVLTFRQEFVLKWVLHPRNTMKAEVLRKAKIPQDLRMER